MYRIKPSELFTIDGDGRLLAVDTLVEDSYTMVVVARGERQTDSALIVVHVDDVSSRSTSAAPAAPTADTRRLMIIVIAVVCGALFLLILITVCFIRKCCTWVMLYFTTTCRLLDFQFAPRSTTTIFTWSLLSQACLINAHTFCLARSAFLPKGLYILRRVWVYN